MTNKVLFIRAVSTASYPSRPTQVGVACQELRPVSALYSTEPPTLPVSTTRQFPTEL